MKKLRRQFSVFFLLMALVLTFILVTTYRLLNQEEYSLWQEIAGNKFNQIQSSINELLLVEHQRSFKEYRYYYVPRSRPGRQMLSVSPLAAIPKNDERGLLGYFQIDPLGHFSTPHLPNIKNSKLTVSVERNDLHMKLRDITKELRKSQLKGFLSQKDPKKPKSKAVILSYSKTEFKKIKKPRSKKRTKKKIEKYKTTKNKQPVRSSVQVSSYEFQVFKDPSAFVDNDPFLDALAPNFEMDDRSPLVFVEPFVASLFEDEYLIFYRKVWIDSQSHIQGFVLQISDFYQWLMGDNYNESRLSDFTRAALKIEGRFFLSSSMGGVEDIENLGQSLIDASFAYPLNLMSWHLSYKDLPLRDSRVFLNVLTGIVVLVLTLGLYRIYLSAREQVLLSEKRQDFVSAVTHELKTPLTSIRLYSEMLEEGYVEGNLEKRQEYYSHIQREAGRLSRLVENTLRLARLEKGNYQYNLVTRSPVQDLEDIAQHLLLIAEQSGFGLNLDLSLDIAEPIPNIQYDPEVLEQVLHTLLDNSLKFAAISELKELQLSLEVDSKNLRLSFRDYGPGVPKSELKKIFQKFYRIENELTRRTQGTGIGLAMVQMLIEGMNARVIAKNEEPGFSVTLIFKQFS